MTDIRHISDKRDKKVLFDIQLNWLERQRGILSAKDVGDTLRVALPQSFGGTGYEWSPEHLFLGAISSCFMTTYFVFADKMGLDISNYECNATGQVGMIEGKYEFTTINLYPKVYITDDLIREKAIRTMEKTQQYCLVSNSVKCRIIYHGEVLHDKHPKHKNATEIF
jgi:peroxiredoxin-like protein